MKKNFILIIPALFIFSCSMNSALQKSFTGKETSVLEEHFGRPTTVLPRSADSLLIFERKNDLEGTDISQGKLTLDPIHSPKVTKIERYYFTVQKGKITGTRYEKFYEK